MQGQQVATTVRKAIETTLLAEGYELVLIEPVPASRVLRLFIDKKEGVTLDDCGQVSRLVGDLLDASGVTESPLFGDGKFTLEVSSPGLDRPLVTPDHFLRFVGEEIALTLTRGLASLEVNKAPRRKVNGILKSATETGIVLEEDAQLHSLQYTDIGRARLVPHLDF